MTEVKTVTYQVAAADAGLQKIRNRTGKQQGKNEKI